MKVLKRVNCAQARFGVTYRSLVLTTLRGTPRLHHPPVTDVIHISGGRLATKTSRFLLVPLLLGAIISGR